MINVKPERLAMPREPNTIACECALSLLVGHSDGLRGIPPPHPLPRAPPWRPRLPVFKLTFLPCARTMLPPRGVSDLLTVPMSARPPECVHQGDLGLRSGGWRSVECGGWWVVGGVWWGGDGVWCEVGGGGGGCRHPGIDLHCNAFHISATHPVDRPQMPWVLLTSRCEVEAGVYRGTLPQCCAHIDPPFSLRFLLA